MTTYGPYSPIRQAGDLYFIAGQVGVDSHSKIAPPDVAAQTHQALQNLKDILESASLTLDDVVKTTIFLKNIDDFAAMNDVYITYFPEPRPARACVAVADLPKVAGTTELLVEVEAIAFKKDPE